MASLNDKIQIPVKCAACGRTTKKSLAELNRNPSVRCACGALIKVTGAGQPAAALDKLDKSLKKLGAKLK